MEETKVDEVAEAPKETKGFAFEGQYKVHNGARDPATRNLRAASASHRGLKQFLPIGQMRVIRGRPVIVTGEQLSEKFKEMRELQEAGLIYVTTMDERVFDLVTLSVAGPVMEPLPAHPPLDSAANDPAGGSEQLSSFANEPAPPVDFEMPVSAPIAAFDVEDAASDASLSDALENANAATEAEEAEHASSDIPSFAKAPAPTHHGKKGKHK